MENAYTHFPQLFLKNYFCITHLLTLPVNFIPTICTMMIRIRMDPEVPSTRKKMSAVSTMVSSLKDSLLTNSRSVTNRNEIALLQILTPAQSLRYLEWFLRNKNRCSKLLANTNNNGGGGVDHESTNFMMKKAESMTELRKQLTETKIEQEVQNTPHDYV